MFKQAGIIVFFVIGYSILLKMIKIEKEVNKFEKEEINEVEHGS